MNVIRFLHVVGAGLWVGGQLLLSLVVLPLARKHLPAESRAEVLRRVGSRFGQITLLLLPVQLATGLVLAADGGLTWSTLAEPGYGRTLLAKLGLLTAAMAAAALHGIATSRGRTELARGAVLCSLVCTLGVVLLATTLAT